MTYTCREKRANINTNIGTPSVHVRLPETEPADVYKCLINKMTNGSDKHSLQVLLNCSIL